MRMKGIRAITLLLSLLVCSAAQAAAIGKGASEITGDFNISYEHTEVGSYRSTSGLDSPKTQSDALSGTLRVGYGYFLTDAVQLGSTISETITSTKPFVENELNSFTQDTYTFNLDLFARYHFYKKGSVFVPYVGAQAGWINYYQKQKETVGGTTSNVGRNGNAISYGGMAGVKYFLDENTSLNAEMNYRRYDIDLGKDAPTATHDVLKWLIGLSYYFGK